MNKHDEMTRLGFWLYILSDVMLFGALFATFLVLRHNNAGGPELSEVINPPYALLQTLVLLTSSFTAAMALAAAKYKKLGALRGYLVMTLLLGAAFLGLELTEFFNMVQHGEGWQVSAALSIFFVLLATHGLHITVGLVWLLALLMTLQRQGLQANWARRLGLFGIFWHFLDIVWIGLFTVVYMFSAGGV